MDKPRLSFWQVWNMSFGDVIEQGGAASHPPEPPARFAAVNASPLAVRGLSPEVEV